MVPVDAVAKPRGVTNRGTPMSDSQLTVAQRWSAGSIFKGAFAGAALGLVGNLAFCSSARAPRGSRSRAASTRRVRPRRWPSRRW